MKLHITATVTHALVAACAILAIQQRAPCADVRQPPLNRTRAQYEDDAELVEREGQFARMYRMNRVSFEALVARLECRLRQDATRSRQRSWTDPVTPATKVACTIRWLAGGSYHDIRRVYRMSKTHFYDVVYQVIDAINDDPGLEVHFPRTPEEREAMAAGFARESAEGVIDGCIGCVDGWLCPIAAPSSNSVGRVSAFFSGHYHRFGINVQACADYYARITAFSCQSAGGCNDSGAFLEWGLAALVEGNTEYRYLVGDNAYPNRRWLLTPFNILEVANRPDRETYNRFLGSTRQVVERAFGIFAKKWSICAKPLSHSLENISRIIHACVRLHNYCINERVAAGTFDLNAYEVEVEEAAGLEPIAASHAATIYDYPSDDPAYRHLVRDAMVEKIASLNLTMPTGK
eukprot:GHVU01017073.1.p1 GENE.GHVU01017073.1~~GHVU01017073.1.p1  ORF type:complete len:405 (+),score=31.62 GHVU01017073.1:240-1454(+)